MGYLIGRLSTCYRLRQRKNESSITLKNKNPHYGENTLLHRPSLHRFYGLAGSLFATTTGEGLISTAIDAAEATTKTVETRPSAHDGDSAVLTTLTPGPGRPQVGWRAGVDAGTERGLQAGPLPQHLLPRLWIPKTCSTMAALASRAKTNWPMRSFSSGWIDRTASSHSARLGSQVPQEKAQRTPSIAGTKQTRLAGKTIHWKQPSPPPRAWWRRRSRGPTPFFPASVRKGRGVALRPRALCPPRAFTFPWQPRSALQEKAAGGGDGAPPLRSAAAWVVTWGGASEGAKGGTKAESRRVTPVTLGGALTGQRCRPIAVSPLEAERLGWRFGDCSCRWVSSGVWRSGIVAPYSWGPRSAPMTHTGENSRGFRSLCRSFLFTGGTGSAAGRGLHDAPWSCAVRWPWVAFLPPLPAPSAEAPLNPGRSPSLTATHPETCLRGPGQETASSAGAGPAWIRGWQPAAGLMLLILYCGRQVTQVLCCCCQVYCSFRKRVLLWRHQCFHHIRGPCCKSSRTK